MVVLDEFVGDAELGQERCLYVSRKKPRSSPCTIG